MSGNIENKTVIFGEVKGPIKVDPTLTHEGEAAESATVGRAIGNLKDRLDAVNPSTAENILYDNSSSGLASDNMQAAVDEMADKVSDSVKKSDEAVKNALKSVDDKMSEYMLSSDKPIGTYIGDGSSAERVIETGGSGNILTIYCTYNALPTVIFVTKFGAIVVNGTSISSIGSGYIRFEDGSLHIATTNKYVNTSGTTYSYQVL